jgi:hypothetical protein
VLRILYNGLLKAQFIKQRPYLQVYQPSKSQLLVRDISTTKYAKYALYCTHGVTNFFDFALVEGGKEKERLSVFCLWTEEKFPGIRRVDVKRLDLTVIRLGIWAYIRKNLACIKLVCKRLALLLANLLLQQAVFLSPHIINRLVLKMDLFSVRYKL